MSGDAEMQKGEAALKKFTLFGNKHEKAVDFFESAANKYKQAQEWEAAAGAFLRAADMHKKLDQKSEVVEAQNHAASMYRKCDPPKAADCLVDVWAYYDQSGKYARSAKIALEIAELYEKLPGKTAEAIQWFQTAVDNYKNEGSMVTANQAKMKIVHYKAQQEEYDDAVNMLEEIITDYLDNNTNRMAVKNLLALSCMCLMAKGMEADDLRSKFEGYQDLDAQFNNSTYEYRLIEGCIDAIEEGDVGKFQDSQDKYEDICTLEQLQTKLLLRAKHKLKKPSII
eukprot:TRINITY_DN84525_c0_g1_i1.p1 TRINITY_DN84525_c0_g1~~TRINITY_DN84525_c0_g1_i1.p1  ORF type:complete len:294 (+),score=51.34 TRINITY_DN84525_c0_g1_i1:36-884(+)